ncbi:hypothetical protein J3F83DRAFT_738438 [Trichoderma novae-zelandiae]
MLNRFRSSITITSGFNVCRRHGEGDFGAFTTLDTTICPLAALFLFFNLPTRASLISRSRCHLAPQDVTAIDQSGPWSVASLRCGVLIYLALLCSGSFFFFFFFLFVVSYCFPCLTKTIMASWHRGLLHVDWVRDKARNGGNWMVIWWATVHGIDY